MTWYYSYKALGRVTLNQFWILLLFIFKESIPRRHLRPTKPESDHEWIVL